MNGPAVVMRGVCKRFAADWVLEDIDVEFPTGVTTAVVGESGSGKSTLLQLINAVYTADRGAIEVLGEPIPDTRVHLWRRKIGYSVQGAGLFPHLTVRDNVTLLGRLSRLDAQVVDDRAKYLMELMGLPPELATRFPNVLSGGEQQRVGLCRALLLQPKLLLLDEPFSALDPIARTGLYELFDRLRSREAVTTVLVTHDMGEALRLAGHLLILRAGRVQQIGAPEAILRDPANDYVKTLLAGQLA